MRNRRAVCGGARRLVCVPLAAALLLSGADAQQLVGRQQFRAGRAALFERGDTDAAREAFAAAARVFRETDGRPDWAAWSQTMVGVSLQRDGRLAEALSAFETAAAELRSAKSDLRDRFLVQVLVLHASGLRALGNVDAARGIARAAKQTAQQATLLDDVSIAVQVHHEMARCLDLEGRYADALAELDLAIGPARSRGELLAPLMGTRAAVLTRVGRYAESEQVSSGLLGALRRARSDATTDRWTLEVLVNRAIARVLLEAPDRALEDLDRAAVLCDRIRKGRNTIHLAHLLQVRGLALREAGRPDQAVEVLRRAHEVRAEVSGPEHIETARCVVSLALALQQSGRGEEASPLLRKAIAVGEKVGSSELFRWVSMEALHYLDVRNDPARADARFAVAMDHIDSMRERSLSLTPRERSYLVARLDRVDAYVGAFRAAMEVGDVERAVDLLERGRGRSMLDLLVRRELDPLGVVQRHAEGTDDAGLARRAARAQEEAERADAETQALEFEIASLRTRRDIDEATRRKRTLEASRRLDAARRSGRRARRARSTLLRDRLPAGVSVSVREVLRRMPADSHLLFYTVSDRGSWVVHGRAATSKLRVHALRWRDGKPVCSPELAGKVSDYVDAISAPSEAERGRRARRARTKVSPTSLGERLFEALVPAAVRPDLDDDAIAFVIPHGPLHRLPFEALLVKTPGKKSSVPWLVEGPSISYAPSASIVAWALQRSAEQRAASTRNRAIVALGDPVYTRDGVGDLAPLPGSRREVAAIAQRVGAEVPTDDAVATLLAAPRDEEPPPFVPLVGEMATRTALEQLAADARVLHLATHQTVDPAGDSHYNRLALTRPADPARSGESFLTLLDLFETWRGKLNCCELVVLSACETQRGSVASRVESGEGVQALPWGFQFAGCPSVIASLWPVGDESTARLMALFYERLGQQEGDASPFEKLRAFTDARRTLHRDTPKASLWASFVFLGAPR